MQYHTTPHAVQAVTWNGTTFSETPEWLPPIVGPITFVVNPTSKLHCDPPYAWYGSLKGLVRLNPGDALVAETGHDLRVWNGETFRDVFQPDT